MGRPAFPYDEAASTPEYRSAYEKAMTGNGDALTEAERQAVAEVRRQAGTATGYPVPPAEATASPRRSRPATETRIDEGGLTR